MRFSLLLMASFAAVISGCGSNSQATVAAPDPSVTSAAAAASISSTTISTSTISTSTPSTPAASTTVVVSASTDPATVSSTTTQRITSVPVDEPCNRDRKLLEIAIETYYAQNGDVPTAMGDLVGDFLTEPVDSYDVMPGGELERRTGVACGTEDVASDGPASIETVEDALTNLGGDQFVAAAGGIECATEIAVIVLAAQAYAAVNGADPAELADLDDFLEREITRWVWQPERQIVIPAPGSGCLDLFNESDESTRCEVERTTLEVASEAYRAQQGKYPRSQIDLLVQELMLDMAPDFTVTDGVVEPVAGSSCDNYNTTADTPPQQTTTTTVPQPTYTLDVHSDGCGVFRSGEIGDDLTWVVTDLDGFQVLGRNAAGETQYRYFRSGTYTVALEAWGGGYSVTVSNEVTITC